MNLREHHQRERVEWLLREYGPPKGRTEKDNQEHDDRTKKD